MSVKRTYGDYMEFGEKPNDAVSQATKQLLRAQLIHRVVLRTGKEAVISREETVRTHDLITDKWIIGTQMVFEIED